jgi:TfoX/Sxy family transcriptional regulator of competence genes
MGFKARPGFDEELALRVRVALGPVGVSERKMFGGLCFLVDGNMACGIVKDEVMVRVGPEAYEQALSLPHARPMDFTGRPMRGMVYVGRAGLRTNAGIKAWAERGARFARSLPAK